tara:strand:- start:2121 stop:2408 length:288 start_codon:yes stop_codon:yes gene_type:complete
MTVKKEVTDLNLCIRLLDGEKVFDANTDVHFTFKIFEALIKGYENQIKNTEQYAPSLETKSGRKKAYDSLFELREQVYELKAARKRLFDLEEEVK